MVSDYSDFLTLDDLAAIPLEDEPIHLAMGICLPSKKQIEECAKQLAYRMALYLEKYIKEQADYTDNGK